MHAGYSLGVDVVWDAGVGNVVFGLVVKKGVFYSKAVGCKGVEKVFST
jgi:hypothetical protein